MNKYSTSFGIKNIKIGNLIVYTIKIRLKGNSYIKDGNICIGGFKLHSKVVLSIISSNAILLTYESSDSAEAEIVIQNIGRLLRYHAQTKLNDKYN